MIGRYSALARRLYLHVCAGGRVTENDMNRLVRAIEELEAEIDKLTEDKPR